MLARLLRQRLENIDGSIVRTIKTIELKLAKRVFQADVVDETARQR